MNSTRTLSSSRLTCGSQIRKAHGLEGIEYKDSKERCEFSLKPRTELIVSGIETEQGSAGSLKEAAEKIANDLQMRTGIALGVDDDCPNGETRWPARFLMNLLATFHSRLRPDLPIRWGPHLRSQALGIPVNAFKSRIFQARRKLAMDCNMKRGGPHSFPLRHKHDL